MNKPKSLGAALHIFGPIFETSATSPAVRGNDSESWIEFEATTGSLGIGQPTNVVAQKFTLSTGPTRARSIEQYIAWYGLGSALEHLRAIAAEALGALTTVEYRLRDSQEGDQQQLVAEVRFPRGKDAKQRLTRFLERFVMELPVKAQQRITLLRLPA